MFKYVYGPVESWRMGKSLGIDPISDNEKVCNMDCVYCQLGKTHVLTNKRKVYVPTKVISEEIKQFFSLLSRDNPNLVENIDYLTFSGRGEPTLAKNLGEMIQAVRAVRNEEIAVITNSSLMHLPEVRTDLSLSDLVVAKLDACDEQSFRILDRAAQGVSFEKVLEGIKNFRATYSGKLAIQIMLVEENRNLVKEIAGIIRDIGADEIQINTPLRPSAARPLSKEGVDEIKSCFRGMPATTIYECCRKESIPFNASDTIKRHGNYKNRIKEG